MSRTSMSQWVFSLLNAMVTVFCGCAALAILAGAGWLLFWVPRLKKQFEGFDTELPRDQIAIIMASDLMLNYWYLLVPLALALCALLVYIPVLLWQTPASRTS